MNAFAAIKDVVTGLNLVAFIVAAALFAFTAWLKNRAKIIQSASEKDRLKAIATMAQLFRIDPDLLPHKKAQIVEKRIKLFTIVVLVIAILLFVIAVIALLKPPAQTATPELPTTLANSHFDVTDRRVVGGWQLLVTNSSTEQARIYDARFSIPKASVPFMSGPEFKIDPFLSIQLITETGENSVTIPKRDSRLVRANAYGCFPNGMVNWQFLHRWFTETKALPEGTCTISIKISSAIEAERRLEKKIPCNALGVQPTPPQCP